MGWDVAACFDTTPVIIDYDAANAVHDGANFTYVDDAVAGLAADRLVVAEGAPTWAASDPEFGGLPTVSLDGTASLVVQTPASATEDTQPNTVIIVATPPSGASNPTLIDGAAALVRRNAYRTAAGGAWYINFGTGVSTTMVTDDVAHVFMLVADTSGAGSYLWLYDKGGAIDQSAMLSVGTHKYKGLRVGSNYAGNYPAALSWNRILVLSGIPTEAEIARLVAWAHTIAGFKEHVEAMAVPDGATVAWVEGDSQTHGSVWARTISDMVAQGGGTLLVDAGDLTADAAVASWAEWQAGLAGSMYPDWTSAPHVAACPGNHDGLPGQIARWQANLAGQDALGPSGKVWRTFAEGNIRWILLDCFDDDEDQTAFVVSTLADAAEPHVVPVYHIRTYPMDDLAEVSDAASRVIALPWIQAFEDSGKVRLVLHGHCHYPEVTHPMRGGVRSDSDGIVYVSLPTCTAALSVVVPDLDRVTTITNGDRTDIADATNFARFMPDIPHLGHGRIVATPSMMTLEVYRRVIVQPTHANVLWRQEFATWIT